MKLSHCPKYERKIWKNMSWKFFRSHFWQCDDLIFSFWNLWFGYSEEATKFENIFHVKFDVTEKRQILSVRFFQILWPSQNIRILLTFKSLLSKYIYCENLYACSFSCFSFFSRLLILCLIMLCFFSSPGRENARLLQ